MGLIDCNKCNAKCCREQHVEILADEWEEIHKLKPNIVPNKDFGEIKVISPPCPFLENDKCSIYEIRPAMCRCYPFIIMGIQECGVMGLGVSTQCPQFLNPLCSTEEGKTMRRDVFIENVKAYSHALGYFEKMSKKKIGAYRKSQMERAEYVKKKVEEGVMDEDIILFYSVMSQIEFVGHVKMLGENKGDEKREAGAD